MVRDWEECRELEDANEVGRLVQTIGMCRSISLNLTNTNN